MKRPVIGVTGDRDESNGRYYIKQEYIQAVWQAGGVPLIIEYPLDIPQNWSGDRKAWLDSVDVKEEIFDRVDGLLFTGGCDVDPAFFLRNVSVSTMARSILSGMSMRSPLLKKPSNGASPVWGCAAASS
jgi:gamma-glutamyl-gamma-aminobutyrate hydrolase PuuD